jgi:hypothetical protein
MNLTVGPLPPAVYWRRRALVLGVVLLLVILFVSMCTAAGGSGKGGNTADDPAHLTGARPSSSLPAPVVGDSPDGTADPGAGGGATALPTGTPVETQQYQPGAPACTDAQISLVVSVQPLNVGYYLTMKVRNVSTAACNRDVGSGPQELQVRNSANAVVWSSNYCQSASQSPDPRTFGPNIETTFRIYWSGKAVKGPTCGPTSALPAATYMVLAKLGTKVSAPATFTVSAAK